MKLLNGSELAGFIKERQANEVKQLFSSTGFKPKLAIIVTVDHPVIDLYTKLKGKYGDDIGVDVELYKINQANVPAKIDELNKDKNINGIIIQLPLEDPKQTEELVNLVDSNKDVDALGKKAKFDPATPLAILWLLAGYNIDLNGKKVLLVGKGKLVGDPLYKILIKNCVDAEVIKKETYALESHVRDADVIISATGSPGIIYADMIKNGAVVVDAGVASEDGKTVGDVADDAYKREDITITPKKGGVGPLTVSALFENVILATKRSAKTKK